MNSYTTMSRTAVIAARIQSGHVSLSTSLARDCHLFFHWRIIIIVTISSSSSSSTSDDPLRPRGLRQLLDLSFFSSFLFLLSHLLGLDIAFFTQNRHQPIVVKPQHQVEM